MSHYCMKKEKKLLAKIAQKYSLELILLFGSRVLKKIHKKSDYDIGYLSRKHLSIRKEGKLILDLAPLLKIPLEKIELISLKNLSPLFLREIFTNSKVLYAKDETIFDNYKIYALRLFEESKPIFEQAERVLRKQVEKYKKELALK